MGPLKVLSHNCLYDCTDLTWLFQREDNIYLFYMNKCCETSNDMVFGKHYGVIKKCWFILKSFNITEHSEITSKIEIVYCFVLTEKMLILSFFVKMTLAIAFTSLFGQLWNISSHSWATWIKSTPHTQKWFCHFSLLYCVSPVNHNHRPIGQLRKGFR